MENHGILLKKLLKRKDVKPAQAADMLGISRTTLYKWFSTEEIEETIREKIEKIFQVPPAYFPTLTKVAEPAVPYGPPGPPDCWQQLVAAQAKIIELQQQIIDMSRPRVNAPVGKLKGQPT